MFSSKENCLFCRRRADCDLQRNSWPMIGFLSHIYIFVFFFFLRFISAPLAPTIDHPTTRSRAISDFNNRARARRKYCFCDNREQNIFQGTKDLFFFYSFFPRATHTGLSSAVDRLSANDDCETRERRKVHAENQGSSWARNFGKFRELKGGADNTCHDRLGSFCKQVKNSWQDCSERLEEIVILCTT